MNFADMPLFRGMNEQEISSLFDCLTIQKRRYRKGDVILSEGNTTETIGIVLDGMAIISYNDAWGNSNILGNVEPGATFAEAYACIPDQPLLVTVFAAEDTTVMFLNPWRAATVYTNACPSTQDLFGICYPSAPARIFSCLKKSNIPVPRPYADD